MFRTHTLTTQSQSAGSRRRSKQFSSFFCVSTVRLNASPQQENLYFYSFLLSSCEFPKVDLGILRYFPLFYWLFKEKLNIFITFGSYRAIFWTSTEKAKFFVTIPSLYFYSGRLRRYSVWSLHCSILALKDSVFQGPTFDCSYSTHSQVFHLKICSKLVRYKIKQCTKFYFFTYKSHRDTQFQVEVSIPRPCTWLVYWFYLSWSYSPPTCGIFCLTFLGIKWLQLQFLIAVPLLSSVPVPDTHLLKVES